MLTKIQKWDGELGVRLPESVVREAAVEEGTPVDVAFSRGQVVISPVPAQKPRLQDLLDQITPENVHGEVEFGEPVGQESW